MRVEGVLCAEHPVGVPGRGVADEGAGVGEACAWGVAGDVEAEPVPEGLHGHAPVLVVALGKALPACVDIRAVPRTLGDGLGSPLLVLSLLHPRAVLEGLELVEQVEGPDILEGDVCAGRDSGQLLRQLREGPRVVDAEPLESREAVAGGDKLKERPHLLVTRDRTIIIMRDQTDDGA